MTELFKLTELSKFEELRLEIGVALLAGLMFNSGNWQSQDVSSRPEMATREITNAILEIPIQTSDWVRLLGFTQASNPWAEDHFQERVSGRPLNPPPSEAWWPYAQKGNAEHKNGEQFSHTYPERFWPKFANAGGKCADSERIIAVPIVGIRYEYGDLQEVVGHLNRYPYSRQAYLPVWFPEDTGVTHGDRVPCTIGYQFLHRGGYMDITYTIRSCDFMRHWRDDVYMAGRLLQWMCDVVQFQVHPRNIIMQIGSFHIFEGDVPNLSAELKELAYQIAAEKSRKIMEAYS